MTTLGHAQQETLSRLCRQWQSPPPPVHATLQGRNSGHPWHVENCSALELTSSGSMGRTSLIVLEATTTNQSSSVEAPGVKAARLKSPSKPSWRKNKDNLGRHHDTSKGTKYIDWLRDDNRDN